MTYGDKSLVCQFLVVDPSHEARKRIRQILEARFEARIQEAATAETALRKCSVEKFRLIITGLSVLNDTSILELLSSISVSNQTCSIILFSETTRDWNASFVASAIVIEGTTCDDLVEAIDFLQVCDGKTIV